MKMKKVTFSVPVEIVDDLSVISKRIGVSRSALLSELLSTPLHEMRELVEGIPENPEEVDIVRFKGKSEKVVKQRMQELEELSNDLFSH